MIGIVIFGIFCGVIIIGLFVWLIKIIKEKDEELYDDVIFHNFMPQFANGHFEGAVLDFITGEKRTGVKFIPKDIDRLKYMKDRKKIEIQPEIVYFENSLLKSFPKGTLSNERNILWGLPPKAELLQERLKETDMGKIMMRMIEENSASNEERDILRMRQIRQRQMLEKSEGLKIAEDTIELLEESNKQIKKGYGKGEIKPGFGISPPERLE